MTSSLEKLLQDLPQGTSEDKELTLSFQRGDASAYVSIYERHAPRVMNVCRRMLGNPHDAEEAVQETFLRVYQALPRFNGRYQMGAWIVRIATNVCLDTIRARARKHIDSTPVEELELHQSDGIDAGDPLFSVIRKVESRRIRRMLASLPPLHRDAIVLRDLQGMSYCDIAVALGLSESQVKALIHRARKGFRRSWASTAPALLIPTKLLERIRRMVRPDRADVTGTTGHTSAHIAELASSGSQFAASCTGILQQCSQLVGERVAPVFAAALMGTAAGAAIASSPPEKPTEIRIGSSVDVPQTEAVATGTTSNKKKERSFRIPSSTQAPATVTMATPEPEPSPASETSTASPSPSPSASDGSKSSPSGSTSPSPSPTPPPPEPTGFGFAFGHDRRYDGEPCCLRDTTVESETVLVSHSSVRSVDQTISGSATAAGSPAYGLWLQYSAGQDSARGRFFLQTREGSYGYALSIGTGTCDRTDWGGWSCRYESTYSLSSRPSSKELMPQHGEYALELTVSAKRKAVLSASFVLVEAGN